MKNERVLIFAVAIVIAVIASGCGVKATAVTDQTEVAQSVGDFMSSVDESTGTSDGGVSLQYSEAGLCAVTGTYSTCASGVITRTFTACTIGSTTLNGTVTLTLKDASGVVAACGTGAGFGTSAFQNGYSITREPNFTITGRRGATMTVTSEGGQKLKRVSATSFTFENAGVKRVLTNPAGVTLVDITTKTTSAITITGATRATRVMSGGELQITHNTQTYTATLKPDAVTWNTTCSCPISGKWTGTVTGSASAEDFTIEITGCGTAKVTSNEKTEELTFDRCGAVS